MRLLGWGRWAAGRCMALMAMALALSFSSDGSAQSPPLYRNPSAPVEQRVEDLLSRMTLDEKVAQLMTVWTNKTEMLDDAFQFDPAEARRNFPNGIGQFARPQDISGPMSPR